MVDSLRSFCIARWITNGCYRGQIHGVNGASSALHWIDDPAITAGVSKLWLQIISTTPITSILSARNMTVGNVWRRWGCMDYSKRKARAINGMNKTLLKGECTAFFEQREPVTNAESSATQFVESACFVGCS